MHWQGSFHRTKTCWSRSTILSGKNTIEERKITKKSTLFLGNFTDTWWAFVLFRFGGNGFSRCSSSGLRWRVWVFWQLIFKLFTIFAWIKKMLQSFLVNWPVFLVPGKYKAFPSIQIFFADELYRNNSSGPGRDNWSLFLVFTFVVVISSNDCNKITS